MMNGFLVRVLLIVFLQCGVSAVQAGLLDGFKKDVSEVLEEAKQKVIEVIEEVPDVAEEMTSNALDTAKDVIKESKSKGVELLKKLENTDREGDVNRDLYGI